MSIEAYCLLFIFFGFCHPARIYYSKCSRSGFTCETTTDKKIVLTYQCPTDADDATIYINQMSAPSNIQSLIIKDCRILRISTRCSSERKPIKLLNITNIGELIFEKSNYESSLPSTVNLENIANIKSIPSKTFAQVDNTTYSHGCYAAPIDFQSLRLKNVSIDILETNAIYGKKKFSNFTMESVKISRIQAAGIWLNLAATGSFMIKDSEINVLEPLAIQVEGYIFKFYANKFFDIAPSAINGTVEIFHFFNNKVGSLQAHGISLLVQYCYILDNHFEYLKSNAFANIGPGLLHNNHINIGKLKFNYSFTKNVLGFTEAGSLHPDIVSYDNVGSDTLFEKNFLYCTCENLGWLVSSLGHGYNTVELEFFYEIVLDRTNENNCSYSCDLPVVDMKKMVTNGKCLPDVTVDYLCLMKDTTTTEVETSTFTESSIEVNRENTVRLNMFFFVQCVVVIIFFN